MARAVKKAATGRATATGRGAATGRKATVEEAPIETGRPKTVSVPPPIAHYRVLTVPSHTLEDRINDAWRDGWRVVNISLPTVVLERKG